MRPACHRSLRVASAKGELDRLVPSIRLRLRVCTVLAVLHLLGTLLV
jgi:hypothetical protein